MVSLNDIWVEKYRPRKIEDLVLEEETRRLLDKFVSEASLPHLIFAGHVGTGKTTVAKILLNTLDCDSITLNASSERGIDVIRNKVQAFATTLSFKKWKIVFLDESDSITPDAQFSLRNLMETYSMQTRFILTCNYPNKIIEPIRSRCQFIEFHNLGRKHILVLLKGIMEKERVDYDGDDLLTLIDTFYPDVRSMINHLQLHTVRGKYSLKGIDGFRNLEQLLGFLKAGDIKGIRELDLDYVEAYKYLFDEVDDLTEDYSKRLEFSLTIAEYLHRDVFSPVKAINFAACCLSLMEKLKT